MTTLSLETEKFNFAKESNQKLSIFSKAAALSGHGTYFVLLLSNNRWYVTPLVQFKAWYLESINLKRHLYYDIQWGKCMCWFELVFSPKSSRTQLVHPTGTSEGTARGGSASWELRQWRQSAAPERSATVEISPHLNAKERHCLFLSYAQIWSNRNVNFLIYLNIKISSNFCTEIQQKWSPCKSMHRAWHRGQINQCFTCNSQIWHRTVTLELMWLL